MDFEKNLDIFTQLLHIMVSQKTSVIPKSVKISDFFASKLTFEPLHRDWQRNNWFETSDSVSLFLFREMNQESTIFRSCFKSKNQETVFSIH